MNIVEASQDAVNATDPRVGLRAVVSLRSLADALEMRHVEAALASGMSWQTIADALGVSRQAVHKKYAKRVDQRHLRVRGRA
ncbi:hypothetical protein ACFSWE_01475 [Leucobacter albus]|uniref:Homeodomain-like domain-containing protein n=1 Tax=Leucobacter albus TaxID=272210 RepID=A0ABW3TP07_9MICO